MRGAFRPTPVSPGAKAYCVIEQQSADRAGRREARDVARPPGRLAEQRGDRQTGAAHRGAEIVERDDLIAIIAAAILHRQDREDVAGVFFGGDAVGEAPAEAPAKARTSPQEGAQTVATR